MRILSKRFMKRLAFIVVFFFAISQLTSSCFSFRMNKKETVRYFREREIKPNLVTYQKDTWDIHYAEIGSDTLPLVLFVHGAPGSWSAFRHFMKDEELLSVVHLVSVDRPGYGYSNFGRPETSIEKQAMLIKPILDRNKSGKPAILIGHSLGGPIIARIAMDFPDQVACLIFIAPSIDPELEPNEWYRLPLYLPIIRWILPTSFDMTNREIYHLKDELLEMVPLWEKIKSPITVIQGGEDKLVDPGNAEFAKKMIINAPVEVLLLTNANHFIPWNNAAIIKETILTHLEKNSKIMC